jgi:hypothetical protein
MAQNRPDKPNITLPDNFGGTQTPFDEELVENGYEPSIPQVIEGGNLNWFINGFFQNIKYVRTVLDYVRDTPIGKMFWVNQNGQMDYVEPAIIATDTEFNTGTATDKTPNVKQVTDALDNLVKKIFPVGSIYSTVGNTNPNSILGFGTWTLLTSSVVTSVQSYVAVIGNGKGLGLTDGTTEGYLASWRPGSAVSGTLALSNSNTLGNNQGNYATGSTSAFGISSDPTKSGLIADTSSLATLKTIYIWQRTA